MNILEIRGLIALVVVVGLAVGHHYGVVKFTCDISKP